MQDFHGVADAAMDLREIDREIEVIRSLLVSDLQSDKLEA